MNDTLKDEVYPTGISPIFGPFITTWFFVVYLPLFVGILVGNGLVIVAFTRNRGLRKVSNYFLVSLAATDFLTGLIAVPLNMAPRLIRSPATCYESSRFNFFLPTFVFGGSSIYHLSAIAIDRLISVYRPFEYPSIVTPSRVGIALTIIWIYSLIFALVPFTLLGGETDQWVCAAANIHTQDITFINLIVAIFIPIYFIAMLVLYGVILRKAVQHIRARKMLAPNSPGGFYSDAKAHLRGLVTMALIVGAFGICWIPTSVQFFVEIYFVFDDHQTLILVQSLGDYLAFVNSMVNPVIYALRNKEFGAAMKSVVTCSKPASRGRRIPAIPRRVLLDHNSASQISLATISSDADAVTEI